MKFWNDFEGAALFNHIFTTSISIGVIKLFNITIDNSRPTIILEFYINELPDAPPAK